MFMNGYYNSYMVGDYVEWYDENGNEQPGGTVVELHTLWGESMIAEIVVRTEDGYRIINPNSGAVYLHEPYSVAPMELDEDEEYRLKLYHCIMGMFTSKKEVKEMVDYIFNSDRVDDFDPDEWKNGRTTKNEPYHCRLS